MDATIFDQGLDSQIVSDEEAVAERSDKDGTSMDLMEDDFFDPSKHGHLSEDIFSEDTSTGMSNGKSVDAGTFAQDPELMVDFVMESGEHFAVIEEQLLRLERDPDAEESIHAVFRAFHTIKGLAGFLELHGVRNVAHEVETLLDKVRNKKLAITPKIVDLILASTDYLKDEVAAVHAAANGLLLPTIRSNKPVLEGLRELLSVEDAAVAASKEVRVVTTESTQTISLADRSISAVS